MEVLPAELVGHLCTFLDTAALRYFRLTCKTFATIGEEHLFSDFEFRLLPNLDRLASFERLVGHTPIASRLNCLSLESGIQLEYADYRYWHSQVYHQRKNEWERALPKIGASKEEYADFHKALEARFTPELGRAYEAYRWHLDQQAAATAGFQSRQRLRSALTKLNGLNVSFRIKLIMTEPQIGLETLEAFLLSGHNNGTPMDLTPRTRVSNRRQYCLSHFVNLLDAVILSHCNVKYLTAVDVPQELLTCDIWGNLLSLEQVFDCLEEIDLKISTFPHSDWLSRGGGSEIYRGGRNVAARQLRALLNRPSSLTHLSLDLPIGQEPEYSFEVFDQTNLDKFPRLWSAHLRSLSLCYFRCPWADLHSLLNEASELSRLTLKQCRLETGSLIDLLEYLRHRRIPHTSLLGTWYVDVSCTANF
jgi:hypothetical protein